MRVSDPRNKIFALFGLLESCAEEGLEASYTKSTDEVYAEIAEFLIQQYNSLAMLAAGGAKEISSSALQPLPFWVPDWSLQFDSLSPFFTTPSTNYISEEPIAHFKMELIRVRK